MDKLWLEPPYWWFRFRMWKHQTRERTKWRIAQMLPRNIALLVFVRVYACIGEIGPDYERVYKTWEAGPKLDVVSQLRAKGIK